MPLLEAVSSIKDDARMTAGNNQPGAYPLKPRAEFTGLICKGVLQPLCHPIGKPLAVRSSFLIRVACSLG